MTTLEKINCTNCLSWIKEKCKTNKIDTTPVYPTIAIEVRPQIQQNDSDNIPTVFAEVQELTFDRNGNPDIIIVKPCQSTPEINSSSEQSRWQFPSLTESHVTDLQRSDDIVQNPDHANSMSNDCHNKETERQDWKPSSHILKYLRLMHICGTAPLAKTSKASYNHDWKWNWLCTIQRAFFWTVVGCAAFDLTCQSKLWLLHFLAGDGFNALVNFAFRLISIGTAVQFALILCKEQEMASMINIISTYEEEDVYERRMPNIAPVLGMLTWATAFALQIFSFGMWDESFLETILYSSYTIGQNLFLWDFKNITSSNDRIFDQYFEPTTSNICLGIVLMIRDFQSSLLQGMMWDLILIVNLVLSCWKQLFIIKHTMPVLDNIRPLDSPDARTLQTARENVFNKWRSYKRVYKHVNIVFGPFLPLFHVTNVLMYAFFLGICILPDETSTAIVYVGYIYQIVKAEITYAVSSRLTQQDDIMRKLLRNWGMRSGKIIVDGEDWDLNALLDELDSEPMVFGTGNFAINQRFHFGIIGLVGSLFVSLANGIGKISSGS